MNRNMNSKGRGEMTVREAGLRGGHKGGEATSRTHGHDFYQEIGKKGGQKVRDLIEHGKKSMSGRNR